MGIPTSQIPHVVLKSKQGGLYQNTYGGADPIVWGLRVGLIQDIQGPMRKINGMVDGQKGVAKIY